MTNSSNEPRDWPGLAIGLFDALTGRQAEITYEFEGLDVAVPSKVGNDAVHTNWKLNGTLRVRTREQVGA